MPIAILDRHRAVSDESIKVDGEVNRPIDGLPTARRRALTEL
jgi:hypothetical protein